MTWTNAPSATTPAWVAPSVAATTWAAPADPSTTWAAPGGVSTAWVAPSTSYTSGNFMRFVDADPLADASGGIDFNNTFSSENPWVFTTRGPVAFRVNREEPV